MLADSRGRSPGPSLSCQCDPNYDFFLLRLPLSVPAAVVIVTVAPLGLPRIALTTILKVSCRHAEHRESGMMFSFNVDPAEG